MIRGLLEDLWLLFGRLFPLPTTPGLREVGRPNRSSPVLVTCNFDLTVRKVVKTLRRDGIDAWLLVAPTRGVNVWCAAGAGHFTTDTVISILETSGVSERVDHRKLILPQLSAVGVNVWSLEERTGWKPRFGPLQIDDLAAYLERGKRLTEPAQRRVGFPPSERLVMGTNLAFASLLLFIIPFAIASIWIPALWWRSILLVFLLAVLNSALVFRLPGKPGVQKGLSLGVAAVVVLVLLARHVWGLSSFETFGWASWTLLLSAYLGYDLPSWSPLWRADVRELLLGERHTEIAVEQDKCIGCHLCDVVCPVDVFEWRAETRKYFVAHMDACQACGACVENCPTDAIVTNFSAGLCACPTCAVINGVGALKVRVAGTTSMADPLTTTDAGCGPESPVPTGASIAEPAPPSRGCSSCSGESS